MRRTDSQTTNPARGLDLGPCLAGAFEASRRVHALTPVVNEGWILRTYDALVARYGSMRHLQTLGKA